MHLRLGISILLIQLLGSSRPLIQASSQAQVQENPPRKVGPIVLPQALMRVFMNNPELTVSELEIHAAAARILQAGLKPNPEFSSEGENLAAMGGDGLFRYTESTFRISQRLELGGKRAGRVLAAEKEMGIARVILEGKKADLYAATSRAFGEVLANQERLGNQRELNRLSRQAHSIVVERVAAGKVSPVEQIRATVALVSAQLEEEKLARTLEASKDKLAALWGGTHRDYDDVQGRFEIPPASSGSAKPCMEENPEVKTASATIDSRAALLALEQAARKPDVTVSAGYRHLNLEGQGAWVAAVSVPLPLFDKRQGAIAEARIRVDKSLSEKKAIEWRLRANLTQAIHDHGRALLEATTLTRTALPAAKEALAAVEEGYRFGKFDFLNVLDAQRTYAELQRRYIEAVASGLQAAIEIERIAHCDSPEKAIPAGLKSGGENR